MNVSNPISFEERVHAISSSDVLTSLFSELSQVLNLGLEFGLIEEAGQIKVFGAGILSSTGEIPFSLSDKVKHRKFVTDEVIETDYDPSRMQDHLFIAPSLPFLRRELEGLVRRFGIPI